MDDFSNNEEMEIPEVLPMMAVRDVVIFNYMIIPLFVGRPGSVEAVNEALGSNKLLMLVTQKDATKDNPKSDDLYTVGMVCMVMRTLKLPDGRLKVLVQAMSKARIKDFVRTEPFYQVTVEVIEEVEVQEITVEIEALMRTVREQTEKIMSLRGILSADLMMIINNIEEPGRLADLVGSNLRLKIAESQSILEETDPVRRLKLVNDLLSKELEVSTVQAKIQNDAKEEMSKSQREYFLREQMHALQKELGDTDDRLQEIEDLERKLKKTKMPKEVRKEAKKQLSRMEMMHPDSSEATIIRTYIDWILDVPWKKGTVDRLDLKEARQVLDDDHYGLEKIKERILEYLAVRKLNPSTKGPILCFVGPPGVGKTSLGQSIARAMGRKFHRISLGGMRDEAEIRGHRRTYIGAMPGRIIQGLKTVESNNPIFMMDEIDKIGSDYRGDPSSALLEVLDPEQNFEFSDHYLNMPFDLSKVMFITTANMTDTIPGPLMDRMEVIRLSGYTLEEKIVIARKYLLPRQIKENGIKPTHIRLTDETLEYIVSHYTYEAGLRNLEREIGKVCRKIARKIAEGGKGPYTINSTTIDRYLGPPKNIPESELEKLEQPGLVTGLAWTEVGRRDPADRGQPDARQGQADPDRPARRCHEGVGAGCPDLLPQPFRGAGRRGGVFRKDRYPHPCPGRGHPQGRTFRRHHHGHSPLLGYYRQEGDQPSGDDRRGHPARPRPADRRSEGKGPGGAAGRHRQGDHPRAEQKGSGRDPAGYQGQDALLSGQGHG